MIVWIGAALGAPERRLSCAGPRHEEERWSARPGFKVLARSTISVTRWETMPGTLVRHSK